MSKINKLLENKVNEAYYRLEDSYAQSLLYAVRNDIKDIYDTVSKYNDFPMSRFEELLKILNEVKKYIKKIS